MGISLIGVDTEDSPANGSKFARARRWPWPELADEDGELLHHLHLVGLPNTLLVGSDGELRGYFTGPVHSTSDLVHIAREHLASQR